MTIYKTIIISTYLLFSAFSSVQQVFDYRDTCSKEHKHIAVVGAGASGSSFAYHLSKLINQQSALHPNGSIPTFSISIFDRNSYIGGRSTTLTLDLSKYTENDDTVLNIELGASIIADVNEYLTNARKEFNLEINDRDSSGRSTSETLGIWDGKDWKYLQDTNSSKFWNSLKFLWRYGYFYGIKNLKDLSKKIADHFIRLYDPLNNMTYFTDINQIIEYSQFTEEIQTPLETYLENHSVNQNLIDEFVAGITWVTYNQSINTVHTLPGLISVFSGLNDMYSIKGGNWQLFEKMIDYSQADLFLNTQIHSITPILDQKNTTRYELSFNNTSSIFDAVILATPLASSNIQLNSISLDNLPDISYIQVHTTLVLGTLDHKKFNLKSLDQVPSSIFISKDPNPRSFDCLGTLGTFSKNSTHSISLYKFFSTEPIELSDFFTEVDWSFSKVWDQPGAYPHLYPWNPEKLDKLSFKVHDQLYYSNLFEMIFSTMESQTLSSKNLANYLFHEWLQE